jgi:hypothetical protein
MLTVAMVFYIIIWLLVYVYNRMGMRGITSNMKLNNLTPKDENKWWEGNTWEV